MPGKLNLYGLGVKGIDLVDTDLHQDPNSFKRLQNAEISNIGGLGGVKKRGGLLPLNSTPLNSGASIQALFNIPLNTTALDILAPWVFLAGSNLAVSLWPTFPTNTPIGTFAPLVALSSTPAGIVLSRPQMRLAGAIGTVMYFISTGADPTAPTLPVLYSYDGTTLTRVVDTGDWPLSFGNTIVSVEDVFSDGVDLYVAATYLTNQVQVYRLAGGTGAPTAFADLIGGLAANTNISIGRINAGAASGLTTNSFLLSFTSNSDGRYRLWVKAPLDVNWSASGGDNGSTARAGGFGFVLFNDIPYTGTFGNFGNAGRILRRTSATNWGTAAFDGPTDGTGVGFGPGIVFDTKIFFPFEDPGTGASRIYVSTTGAPGTWTLDKDFAADFAVNPTNQRIQPPVIFDGDLYWPIRGLTGHESAGMLLKRTTTPVWSAPISGAAIFTAAATYG